MNKPYLLNKEMSDPNWILRKRQEFLALKFAYERLSFGSAYLPAGCSDAFFNIGKELGRMAESIEAWKPEEKRYLRRPKTPPEGKRK